MMIESKVPGIRFSDFTDEWHEYSMGELYKERKEPGNDSLPILSVSIHSGISDGELDEENLGKHVRRIEDKSAYKHAHAGDLVFNMMRAWQGAIGSAPSEGMVSPAYITAEPCERVYPPFMDYYVKRKETVEQINSLSYGVTDFRKRLYWDSFVQVKCKLPTLNEQKAIAAELTHIDEMISTTERNLDKWKELKKGMLQKMFPKEEESVPEIRFPGFTGNWRSCQLKELIQEITAGKSVNSDEGKVESEDIGIMKTSCVSDDRFDVDECKRVVSEEKGIVTCPVEANTLVISRMNTPDRVGACGYVSENMPNRYLPDRLWKVKFAKDIDTYLAYTLLTTEESKERIKALASGTSGSMYNISKEAFMKMNIVFPVSVEEQNCVSNYFKGLNDMIILNEHELGRWQSLKKALLQQMFV